MTRISELFELLRNSNNKQLNEWSDNDTVNSVYLILTDYEDLDEKTVVKTLKACNVASLSELSKVAKALGDPNEERISALALKKACQGYSFAYTPNLDGYNPIVLTKKTISGKKPNYKLPEDLNRMLSDFGLS